MAAGVNYTHPHVRIEVRDNSIYIPDIVSNGPLFRPIFFLRTQQGISGIPQWVEDYNDAVNKYGEGTFDQTTKFFSREALYLRKVFERQGAYMVRMASDDAQYGSVVLCLQVKKVQVPQWKRDAAGNYMLDESTGERIPETAEGGAQLSEPGVELKWTARALDLTSDRPETISSIQPVTYGAGDSSYTVYPIFAIKAKSVGSYANDIGIKFFVADTGLDTTLASNIGSIPYSFGIVKKTYGQDTVSPVASSMGNNTESFVCKKDAVDSRFNRRVDFDNTFSKYYSSAVFDAYLYYDNIGTIGKMVQDVETEDATLTDPYLVNLTEAYNIDGIPMPHVVFSEDIDAVNLTDSRIVYMIGGDDGDISDSAIEELTRQYLKDDIYPELLDQPRYPFTHIIDTGVSIDTKRAFIQFLGKHDGHKCILATQDCTTGRFNTKNEDFSMGAALQAELVLQPESTAYGTSVCRAEIYMQAAKLADDTIYNGIVPTTYDIVDKKSSYMCTTVMRRAPAGTPSAAITVFKKESWQYAPSAPEQREQAWVGGLNYFQYYDENGVYWPALHSVYRYDTSVLSSAAYTDALIVTKHIVRKAWSKFSGREEAFSTFSSEATTHLSALMARAFSNSPYTYNVSFSQSEEEAKIGYISHATVELIGPAQQRVWEVDIVCSRDGYSPEE